MIDDPHLHEGMCTCKELHQLDRLAAALLEEEA